MAAATTIVTETTIESAITALLKYKSKQSSSLEKLQLLPQDDYVYLNITLKNIPSNNRTNPFRIPLPHPILDSTSAELCLIIDDRENTPTPTSDQIKKLVKSQNIPISKVIKLSKLKTNYKPFEAKRKLCDSYDIFLVDKRIVHLLPKLIGKEFFKKKKLPLGVDLGKKNLKSQVERALGSALLFLRSGTCCVVKVGKVVMEKDEIVENVFEAIKGAVEMVPRKWEGVRSLYLKFSDSVALPIYQAMPDVRLKVEGTEEVKGKVSDSEGEGKESSVKKVGKKKKSKGRIHEVRYMDVGDDVVDGVDVDMDDNELVRDEILGDVEIDGSDEDLKVEKTVGKKRKVSEEKKLKKKKKAKVDTSEVVGKTKKNDGTGSVEKKPKKKSEESVAKKSKKNDGIEPVEKKSEKKSDDSFAKKSKKTETDGMESGEIKPKRKGERDVTKTKKSTDGMESGEIKPKKEVEESVVKKMKKSKKIDGMESGEVNPKKKSEKGAAKKTDAMESVEKKGKKKSELEKKLNEGVAKVKDGKQKKRVSFK